jgi:hypothetical protein
MKIVDIEPIIKYMDDPEHNEPYGLNSVELEKMIRNAPIANLKKDNRLNEVIVSQEYADQYGQGAELEKIYIMLRDISTTLAMFYDEMFEHKDDDNIDDMLNDWRFP